MRLPFIKFYPRDWISDPQLRMVSLAARGFWFECLCLMHMGLRRGYLETSHGKPIDVDTLCRLTGTFKGEVEVIRSELIDHGIPSVDENGTWYCRRMVKDQAKSDKCSEAGSRGGGNPSLKNPSKDKEPDNQKPETRNHISKKDAYKGDLYTLRLNALFRRRDTTEWSSKEIKALRELKKREEFEEELDEIERYFKAMRDDGRGQYLRHDLKTLLNNWVGELDRAKNFKPSSDIQSSKQTHCDKCGLRKDCCICNQVDDGKGLDI